MTDSEDHRYNMVPYIEGGYGDTPYGDGDSLGKDGTQAPYGGEPHRIPGRIEAEHFDVGGEGVAYHETDPPAEWALDYRPETGVDVKRAPGTESGMSVGRFEPGEWLEYTVLAEPGTYDLVIRGGTANPDADVEVTLDGETLAVVSMPETGWSAHDTVRVSGLGIDASSADERILRLSPRTSAADVDWVELHKTESMSKTATLELILEANSLTVRVLDGTKDGQPAVEGATVELSGTSEATGTTDTNGEVMFDGVGVGDYQVTAYTSGLHASGSVSSSDFT